MDKVIKHKRGLELVTSLSSGHKTSSENSVIRFILSDQVWWCNVKQFLTHSKNCIWKFMQVNSWHKSFHFYLPLPIWKVWKGREKITKIRISENEKSFLDEIKNIFHRLSFGEKIKIGQKIADSSFKCVWRSLLFQVVGRFD